MLFKALLTLLLLLNTASSPDFLPATTAVEDFPRTRSDSRSLGFEIIAQAGLAVDWQTDKILWSKNPDQILPIASLTKLITGLVLLDRGVDLDQVVVMQRADQRAAGGNRQLYLGESMRVRDLLHSALMASDNEAIMALIRTIGFSEEEFTTQANNWLAANGFFNTTLVEPTGLNPGNQSTAAEVARLAKLAFQDELFYEILKKEEYQFQIINNKRLVKIKNTNQLLNGEFGVRLGKTGYIEEAGYCLTTLSDVADDHRLITVVLGSDTIVNRFQDTKAIIYWVKDNFIWK